MRKAINEARNSVKDTTKDLRDAEEAMDLLYDDLDKIDKAIDSYNRTKEYCSERLNDILRKLR